MATATKPEYTLSELVPLLGRHRDTIRKFILRCPERFGAELRTVQRGRSWKYTKQEWFVPATGVELLRNEMRGSK